MKPTPRSFYAVLLATTLALPAVAEAACTFTGLGFQFLDLKRPFSANFTGGATQLLAGPTPSTRPECAGWHHALLKVRIPAGCVKANIWVEYEGTPVLWTLNVGDSPNNNGFGGNAGEPDSAAELQVLGETLTLYTPGLGPGIVDPLAVDHLALTDGALEVVVGNQFVSWGQPLSAIDTQDSKLGFALPDPAAPEPDVFFVGINRVVSVDSGPGDRTGCGARRVMVSFR